MSIGKNFLLAGFFILASGVSAGAGTAITWNPDTIVIEQKQGTTSKLLVVITSSRDIDGAVVRIAPELLPWINVTPGTIESLNSGDSLKLTLLVRIPDDDPSGTYGGTIQLKEQSGGKPRGTLAKPLPVILSIIDNSGNDGLPPDPGEEGKTTLLGIDSDTDGVRDDIQRWIYLSYPDEEAVRLALTQIAMEYQGLLEQADDESAALEHANRMSRHGECLHYLKGRISGDLMSELKARILNTKDRSLAYIKYNRKLGGHIFSGKPLKEWRNSCFFDIDAVEGTP